MKYIIAYYAKRKNAKRHIVVHYKGTVRYFKTIEEAKKHPMCGNPLFRVEILNSKYELVEVLTQ